MCLKAGRVPLCVTDQRNELRRLLTTKLLAHNPDFYTLWGYRREMLLHRVAGGGPGGGVLERDGREALLRAELDLTREAISRRNPKSPVCARCCEIQTPSAATRPAVTRPAVTAMRPAATQSAAT